LQSRIVAVEDSTPIISDANYLKFLLSQKSWLNALTSKLQQTRKIGP